MLKNKMYIIIIVVMCLSVGCGNSNMEQNGSGTQDSITFAEYTAIGLIRGKHMNRF